MRAPGTREPGARGRTNGPKNNIGLVSSIALTELIGLIEPQ